MRCTGSTGTFDAIVAFPVVSTQNATRKCIALHVPGRTDDIILRNTEAEAIAGAGNSFFTGSGTGTMYAKITGFPCSATQLVCLGAETVTAWETSNQTSLQCTTADQNPPGGQCRREDICVQPFNVTLDCDAVLPGPDRLHRGLRKHTTLVAAAATAPILSGTPLTYKLYLGAGPAGRCSATGPAAATTLHLHQRRGHAGASTIYTVQLIDARNSDCTRTAQVTVTATALDITSATGTPPACDGGASTLTACSTGATDVTFRFSEGGTPLGTAPRDATTGCGSISVVLRPGPHTINVAASNAAGTCTDTAQITLTVPTQVTAALAAPQSGCSGVVNWKPRPAVARVPTPSRSPGPRAPRTARGEPHPPAAELDGQCPAGDGDRHATPNGVLSPRLAVLSPVRHHDCLP